MRRGGWVISAVIALIVVSTFGLIKDMLYTIVSVFIDHRRHRKLRNENTW